MLDIHAASRVLDITRPAAMLEIHGLTKSFAGFVAVTMSA